MSKINCLNPWDIQSKHVFSIDGVCEALYAGECRYGGGEHYVCYAIEIMESNMVRRNEQSKVSESVGCGRKKNIQN